MDAFELQEELLLFIDENMADFEGRCLCPVKSLRTYEDAGLLTRDAGIVISFEDGSGFQLTIVQSARAEGDV